MKKVYIYIIMCLLPLALAAQKKENSNSAISRNLELFNDIYKQLGLFYVDSLNADSVIGRGIRLMLQQIDPFTDYYPEDDEDLRQMATGKYAGIGSVIRYHRKEQRAVISEPYEGTPSQLAGVKAGDVILSIDGKDVKGMLTPKVSSMLRGEAGTTFELKVRRGEEEKSFLITRQTIQLPQVPYSGMLSDGQTGYIYLTGFTDGACREVRNALDDVRRQGAKRLVLDLRGNPGGAVNEAVDIANLFLPKGKKVVYTRGKMKRTDREYYTATEPVDSLMPLVVLVDGGSASSSEIVAGALQDFDRAVVMGAKTYGKGLIQMVREVPYRGSLKVTTSRYYIPSGRCIQAYDYRRLNPDGSVGTIPDSLTNVFHTAAGREVRDGGGIKPDVEVKPDSLPTMIYELVQSDEFFDYVTHFCRTHPTIAPVGEFRFSDEDYAAFADSIQSSGFEAGKPAKQVLQVLRDVIKREGYQEATSAELDALEAKLTYDIRADLMRFRKEVEPFLYDELAHRYYFQKGGVQQQLIGDPCVERALQVLSSADEYKKILTPPAAKSSVEKKKSKKKKK
ncbi:MAG: S41 family peptidase [Bacteroidaceae bacterium]|nr:S41 family peptidase [Bacteroidaceae bacterium]